MDSGSIIAIIGVVGANLTVLIPLYFNSKAQRVAAVATQVSTEQATQQARMDASRALAQARAEAVQRAADAQAVLDKAAETNEGLAEVKTLVNGNHSALVARVDQLTQTITDSGGDVPPNQAKETHE